MIYFLEVDLLNFKILIHLAKRRAIKRVKGRTISRLYAPSLGGDFIVDFFHYVACRMFDSAKAMAFKNVPSRTEVTLIRLSSKPIIYCLRFRCNRQDVSISLMSKRRR